MEVGLHQNLYCKIKHHYMRVPQYLISKATIISLVLLDESDQMHDIFLDHQMMLSPSLRNWRSVHHVVDYIMPTANVPATLKVEA